VTFALDSWAVLRLLEGTEPAAARVEQVLDAGRPVMSWINLGEVFYIVRRHQSDAEAREVVRDLRARLRLDLPSEQRVLAAAALKADHRMAYADAFAAATAVAHGATLLTGDPELLVDDASWGWEDLRGERASR
jgi:predicted nucleic acid-binding protein